MKTRFLLNLVLLCVVAALVLVVVFEPGKEEPKSHPLAPLDENAVERISLQNQESIAFERKDGHWWLKEPFAAPANEVRIRQLIDIAKAESDAQYPLNPGEKAKFELEKPKAVLRLGDTKMVFGGSDPIDMRRYVEIGDTLHLVRDDFFHHLTAKATDYVDKKLLPEEAKINSILIPGLKGTLGADGKWTVEPPVAEGADSAVANLLNAWQSARAIDVKRLDKPAEGELVRIGFANGDDVEFVIVQRDPELVLARSDWGLRYEVVGESAKQLLNLKVPDEPAKEDNPLPPAEAPDDEKAEEFQGTDPDVGEGEEVGVETGEETE